MIFEEFIQIFIFIHAGFGGLALLAGLFYLIAKKGTIVHKIAGKIFYYSMLFSAFVALVISVLPGHHSPFLFAVGIFSSYFIISGYRALRFKKREVNLTVDKTISAVMFFTALAMIFFPFFFGDPVNPILTVFGSFGLAFSIRDLRLFRTPEKLRKSFLKLHAGKMIGGYIAATTAFVVVKGYFPGIYGWFVPGIIGGIYITFWMRKLNKKPSVKPAI